jgi:hypothetical protein
MKGGGFFFWLSSVELEIGERHDRRATGMLSGGWTATFPLWLHEVLKRVVASVALPRRRQGDEHPWSNEIL